jgi:hypothetical protein
VVLTGWENLTQMIVASFNPRWETETRKKNVILKTTSERFPVKNLQISILFFGVKLGRSVFLKDEPSECFFVGRANEESSNFRVRSTSL